PVLTAMNEAPWDRERIKPLEIQLVQVYLVRFRRQPLPDGTRNGFRSVLHEIITPGFPRDHHGVVGAGRGHVVGKGCELGRQDIDDALVVADYERIQENNPVDTVWDFLRHPLNDRSAKTVTNQD